MHAHVRLLTLGELALVVAQLRCDHGLYQHVPLSVQSVPVVGGVDVFVDTAMVSYIHTYIHAYISLRIYMGTVHVIGGMAGK